MVAAKKPTKWATTSEEMRSRLSTRCSKTHSHQHLLGGRAAAAAFYPMPLITEIIRGMRDTADAEALREPELSKLGAIHVSRAALFHDQPPQLLSSLREEDRMASRPRRATTFRMADGSTRTMQLHQNFKPVYKDAYTSEALPPILGRRSNSRRSGLL